MKRVGALLVALFVLSPMVVLNLETAQAQANPADSVVIVLDVSGSMNRDSGSEPGKSRLDVAKEAVTTAIAGVTPGSINLGLRTFARCGSDLVVPLGPADPTQFNQQVDTITAGGSTGIEIALRAAVDDLAQTTGKRTILLISDGQENCGGDPCAAASDLLANNISFVVNTVGFQTVGTNAEQQLQCIANATGGTMTPVENLPDLFDVIDQTVNECVGSLIECYAPEVRFHPAETYFPMDPLDFIAGSELRWVHSADGFAPRTCWKDETIDPHPNAKSLGGGGYVAQQEQHDPGRFNKRRCTNFGKEYNTAEFTRPFQETPANILAGNRAEDLAGVKLETEEGFMLSWEDYGPWWNRSDTPLGLNNDPGEGGAVNAPMFAQIFDRNDGKFIVYHMFYGFDPKSRFPGDGAFAHEGDWERLIVKLDANDRPTEFRFEGHGCDSTFFAGINHVPATSMTQAQDPPTQTGTGHFVDGTHPVIYVAEGSHAAYPYLRGIGPKACDAKFGFKSGQFDETVFEQGKSATWRPWESGQLLSADAQCWYGYGGAWGRSGDILSIGNLADDTGPAGPYWNINGLPVRTPCGAIQRVALSAGNDSSNYGDTVTVSLTGYTPGVEVVVSLASVEFGVAVSTIGADGSVQIPFTIPQGFEPGGHHVIVRAAANGDIMAVDQLNVVAPPECFIENNGESIPGDIDGDNLRDSCDLFPTDGPAADFDGDGVRNYDDNCSRVPNPDQDALANSSVGTACDIDNGHNAARDLYFAVTGTYPGASGPLPFAPAEPAAADPVEYEPFTNAPPEPTPLYGFGLNPQAATPTQPQADSVPALGTPATDTAPADASTEVIAHTGSETRKLAELGLGLVGVGLLTLAYIRREQDH